jgi:hypothetical protein
VALLTRSLKSPWVRRGLITIVALLVCAAIVVVEERSELRNMGGATTCPHFLKMSPPGRARVIEKMGYDPAHITNREFVAEALAGCRTARHTSDEDDTLDDITGP